MRDLPSPVTVERNTGDGHELLGREADPAEHDRAGVKAFSEPVRDRPPCSLGP
jgi:hypothetical protein